MSHNVYYVYSNQSLETGLKIAKTYINKAIEKIGISPTFAFLRKLPSAAFPLLGPCQAVT